MQGELFIIDCPRCGRIEGYAPAEEDDVDPAVGDEDESADEVEFFDRDGKPIHKIRCPRCGGWVQPERTQAA